MAIYLAMRWLTPVQTAIGQVAGKGVPGRGDIGANIHGPEWARDTYLLTFQTDISTHAT